jgi:glycosyltransferase involved in cell wall biosynthesis
MWEMVLEPPLAKAGKFFEHRIAPPLYGRTPIVTLSESSRHELIEYLGLRPERISVVAPGIDERFRPDGEKASTPTVVAVGRLMPSKRFDELITAMVEVRRSVPEAKLVIVGDGYERPNLEAQVDALNATSWIRIAGKVSDDELLSLYRQAWLVASASIAEGWGMTLTEAAACGTPSVASDIAGHRDAVSDGKSGILTPDSRSFVDSIIAVLTDPVLRSKLSAGSLEHAATLTWQATAYGTFAPLAADALRRKRGRRR